MKTIYILLLLMIPITLCAQQRTIREADELFADGEYAYAVPLYESLIKYKHSDLQKYKLAECYRLMKDYKKALQLYAGLGGNEKMPLEYYLNYANMLRYQGNYESAKNYYQVFQKMGGTHPNLDTYIRSCDYAMKNNQENRQYTIVLTNIQIGGLFTGAGINKDNEFVVGKPSIEKVDDGKSTHYNYAFKQIDLSDEGMGSVSDISITSPTVFYVGGPVYNKDGSEVYYSRTVSNEEYLRPGKFKTNSISSDGVNTLSMYKAVVVDNHWMQEQRLSFNDREFSSIHPTLSADGTKMIFASNMDGGKGGYDLYIVKKEGEEWSAPTNLGDKINTPDDEMFPFLFNDTVLYFASDGRIGFGGADIYASRWDGKNWMMPENLGRGINSSYDDFGLIWKDKRNGYFASDRSGKVATDEIYSVSVNVNLKTVEGDVFDKLTGYKLPNAVVKIYADTVLIDSVMADNKGAWSYNKLDPDVYYKLEAGKPGYESTYTMVDPAKSKLSDVDLGLNPLTKKGDVFTFNNILFEYDKADLLLESKDVLNKVADFLISMGARVELSAHTDSRGSDSYNMSLSKRRAESSVNYLISRGVPSNLLVFAGYGETQLKNRCRNKTKCTEEEHQQNRRVEIKILDVK